MPKSLFWTRTNTAGAEHALFDDGSGLTARGTQLAADPIPYTCRYQLVTDASWSTTRVDVEAEGSGWLRNVRLERAAGQWRVTTAEQGDLDAALAAAGHPPVGPPGIEDTGRLADVLDVDLGGSALFNALPVRRLGMTGAPVDTGHRIAVVWVLVPSLMVVCTEQAYTSLGPARVRISSGSFTADIDLGADGYVVRYPGLAERIASH
ncbi:putative glycolipid-binding domain-containing protein [Micromonospora sp. DPT]|uniref:putative glycolipid-binding domain-containing protein n=1 Tax=Micromonospora sp. DPT TaxID=3142975 RepID=UPI00320B9AD8